MLQYEPDEGYYSARNTEIGGEVLMLMMDGKLVRGAVAPPLSILHNIHRTATHIDTRSNPTSSPPSLPRPSPGRPPAAALVPPPRRCPRSTLRYRRTSCCCATGPSPRSNNALGTSASRSCAPRSKSSGRRSGCRPPRCNTNCGTCTHPLTHRVLARISPISGRPKVYQYQGFNARRG